MNIGIVVQNEYPHVGEVRPRRLAQSLHNDGHKVIFLSAFSEGKSCIENIGYAEVNRFGLFLDKIFFSLIKNPSPFNLFWIIWIYKIAKKNNIDVLISSNIRVAIPMILAAKLLRKKAVLDLQENNGELIKYKKKSSIAHYITRNSYFIRLIEYLCIRYSDHIWVVVEERKRDINPVYYKKISVVMHAVSKIKIVAKEEKSRGDSFKIMYVGRFNGDISSIELLLRALPYAVKTDHDIKFLIGGANHSETNLLALIKELNLEDYVELCGVVDPEEVEEWLSQGDVGVICYPVNPFTNTTISNKIFHYMAAGLPVLSTDMVPTRRIVEEVACGVVIPNEADFRQVADKILFLKRNDELLKFYSKNSLNAARFNYNWETQYGTALLDLIKSIES